MGHGVLQFTGLTKRQCNQVDKLYEKLDRTKIEVSSREISRDTGNITIRACGPDAGTELMNLNTKASLKGITGAYKAVDKKDSLVRGKSEVKRAKKS